MRKPLGFLTFIAATAMIATLPGHALAQAAAGSAEAPPASDSRSAADAAPPAGPYRSALPFASAAQFTTAEKLARGAAPSGPAGASASSEEPASVAGQTRAFGTSTAPYTTVRAAVTALGNSLTAANTPVTSYPYRATGKLYFRKPNDTNTYICSASLIKKGILVTAAHCVRAYGGGAAGWYNSFVWCPANTNAAGGVYGCYTATAPRVLTPYFNGTDVCTQAGVVCNHDIATLRVLPKVGVYAGNVVGWYAYGWNGYSYRASSFLGNVTTVQVTQLGYPGAFDSGLQMQRTDAVGWYFTSGNLKNTQIGSAQSGGSSGGPWLVNFGTRPTVDPSRASLGSSINQAVIGVTSYGSTTIGFNRLGASYFGQTTAYPLADYGGFGAGNIGLLVRDTCTAGPAYC